MPQERPRLEKITTRHLCLLVLNLQDAQDFEGDLHIRLAHLVGLLSCWSCLLMLTQRLYCKVDRATQWPLCRFRLMRPPLRLHVLLLQLQKCPSPLCFPEKRRQRRFPGWRITACFSSDTSFRSEFLQGHCFTLHTALGSKISTTFLPMQYLDVYSRRANLLRLMYLHKQQVYELRR